MAKTLPILSRPGRIPAKVNSFARSGACCWRAFWFASIAGTASSNVLTLTHNGIQPRFKIFLSFAPQFVSLYRQCALNRLNPPEQVLDVLPGLCGIFAAVRFD